MAQLEPARICGRCVFFHTPLCTWAQAGYDIIFAPDTSCVGFQPGPLPNSKALPEGGRGALATVPIQVGDHTIEPSLDFEPVNVHPAIGIVGERAYVGVWVPSLVTEKDGQRSYEDQLFIVTSDRKIILANEELFAEMSWQLDCKPIRFENRWSLGHVKAWLNQSLKPPEPSHVLKAVLDSWKTYLEFPDPREYLYRSLWDIGTYFHPIFLAFPYDYLGGVKRAGKTKALLHHKVLAFNAILSNNMSAASLYRLIQNGRCTLLIDETEKLSNPARAQEFRSILLGGYKAGEKVYRVEKDRGEKLVPEAFEVYSPKALANIAGLEDVLEDRCARLTFMIRGLDKAVINREIDDREPKWAELRSLLYTFFLSAWTEVQELYLSLRQFSELSEHSEQVNFLRDNVLLTSEDRTEFLNLRSRERELWLPILTLALYFDRHAFTEKFTSSLSSLDSSASKGETSSTTPVSTPSSLSLFSSMLSLAVGSAKERHIEDFTETSEMVLVQVLLEEVEEDSYIPVKSIKERMAGRFDEKADWLTTRWVGRVLRRLGFKEKRRLGTGYEYRLTPEAVKDLAQRMGISEEKLGIEVEENKEILGASQWRQLKPGIEYLQIPANEPCEQCGVQTVEFEIRGPVIGLKPIRRCPRCFTKEWGLKSDL